MSYDVVTLDSVQDEWPVEPGSVGLVVTSPPFFGKVRYGDDDREIGMGQTLTDFLTSLATVADRVWRVLEDDGVWWLNLGETASGSGGSGGDHNKGGRKEDKRKYRQGSSQMAPQQYMNVVGRSITMLQGPLKGEPSGGVFPEHPWLLRAEIVWDKSPVVRPEDQAHSGRPFESHEKILMLTKSMVYKQRRWHPERARERNNVWHFAPERTSPKWSSGPMVGKKHPAPYPVELPRRCMEMTAAVGDLVLDPFHGSGSTGKAARLLGLNYVGFDLYA